jgi:hypothetical protein
VLGVKHRDDLRCEHVRPGRVGRARAERVEYRTARRLHFVGGAMNLQVAELPLDDEDPGRHVRVLKRNVGKRLDVQPGRDLDYLRRDVASWQGAADPAAEIADRLRLQAVEEDE